VQTEHTISLPGRHCQCGALRAGNTQRCEKCQACSSWYRHNCRRPRSASRPARIGARNDANTRARKRQSAEES
jgi:hypothetical protein